MNRQMLDALFMRRGIPTAHRTPGEVAALLPPGTHPNVEQYLLQLLPETTSLVSGVRLKSLEGIVEENSGAAAPGGFIFPLGYIVIATSIGGNAVCVNRITGASFWADHDHFSADGIHGEDRLTGEWLDLPLSHENSRRVLVALESNLEDFFVKLLSDQYTDLFDSLD